MVEWSACLLACDSGHFLPAGQPSTYFALPTDLFWWRILSLFPMLSKFSKTTNAADREEKLLCAGAVVCLAHICLDG